MQFEIGSKIFVLTSNTTITVRAVTPNAVLTDKGLWIPKSVMTHKYFSKQLQQDIFTMSPWFADKNASKL